MPKPELTERQRDTNRMVRKATSYIGALVDQIEEAEHSFTIAHETMTEQREESNRRIEEIKNQRNNLVAKLEESLEEWVARAAQLQVDIENADDLIKRKNARIGSLKAKKDQLIQSLGEQDNTIINLQQTVQRLKNRNANQGRMIEERDQKIADLEMRLASSQESVAGLSGKVELLDKDDVDKRDARVLALEETLGEIAVALGLSEGTDLAKDVIGEIKTLQENRGDLYCRFSDLSQGLAVVSRTLGIPEQDNLDQELRLIQERAKELHAERDRIHKERLDERDEIITALQGTVEKLKARIAEFEGRSAYEIITELQEENRKLEEAVRVAEINLTNANTIKNIAKNRVKARNERISKLKASLAEVGESLETHQEMLRIESERRKKAVKANESLREALDEKVAELGACLIKLRAPSETKADFIDLQTENANLQAQNADLQDEIRNLKVKAGYSEDNAVARNERIKELQDENERIEELETEVQDLEIKLQSAIATSNGWQKRAIQAETEVVEIKLELGKERGSRNAAHRMLKRQRDYYRKQAHDFEKAKRAIFSFNANF